MSLIVAAGYAKVGRQSVNLIAKMLETTSCLFA
jgi:hypothetical protein